MTGKTLINGAIIRKTVGKIEAYNQAVAAFRNKYNVFPGDAPNASAFFTGAVNGNGNGVLQGLYTGDVSIDTGFTCPFANEYAQFWVHLSNANLVDGKFDGSNVASRGFPLTWQNGGIIAYYNQQQSRLEHRFLIGAANTLSGSLANNNNLVSTFSHMDAATIDRKWDNGIPNTGSITAFGYVITSCGPNCTQYTYTFPTAYTAAETNLLRLHFKMSAW